LKGNIMKSKLTRATATATIRAARIALERVHNADGYCYDTINSYSAALSAGAPVDVILAEVRGELGHYLSGRIGSRVYVARWFDGDHRGAVYVDRVKVLTLEGRRTYLVDRADALKARAEQRVRNFDRAIVATSARDAVDRAVRAGVRIAHYDGQKGGYFVLPSGGTASARGAFKRASGRTFDTAEGWADFEEWVKLAVAGDAGEAARVRGAHLPARLRSCAVAEHFAGARFAPAKPPPAAHDRW
jgi:hypothetical protein